MTPSYLCTGESGPQVLCGGLGATGVHEGESSKRASSHTGDWGKGRPAVGGPAEGQGVAGPGGNGIISDSSNCQWMANPSAGGIGCLDWNCFLVPYKWLISPLAATHRWEILTPTLLCIPRPGGRRWGRPRPSSGWSCERGGWWVPTAG